jgi:hypothetical protein
MHRAGLPFTALTAAVLALAACATTDLARPVGRGNTRVGLSAGGPIAVIGSKPIPAPIVTIGLAHGLYDQLDLQGHIHPFAAAFDTGNGSIPILGADLGFAWHPVHTRRELLSIGGAFYGFTNRLDAVFFTDLWIAAGYRATGWFSFSGGMHNTLRIGTSDETLAERPVWTPTLFAQVAVRPFSGRFAIDLELRWYAFTQNGTIVAPAYVTIGNYGALGILLGFHFDAGNGPRS